MQPPCPRRHLEAVFLGDLQRPALFHYNIWRSTTPSRPAQNLGCAKPLRRKTSAHFALEKKKKQLDL